MRALLGTLALAAACGDPPFTLKFRITQGDSNACVSGEQIVTRCSDVTFPCDAVVSIRVVPPADPTVPFISMCRPLTRHDACGIASIDLKVPDQPVAEQRLLVEMALYPTYLLPKDDAGEPQCPPPSRVSYAADGFPLAQPPPCDKESTDPTDPQYCWPTPAIGGSAYYTPGDAETVVDLGCTNMDEFQGCTGVRTTMVTASVDDFDQPIVSVPQAVADRLEVQVGEPTPSGAEYLFTRDPNLLLERSSVVPPAWAKNVPASFMSYACLDVLEDVPQSTSTLTCRTVTANQPSVDLDGYRLSKTTLDQVLGAIDGQSSLGPPFTLDKGLVIGIVLDSLGNPAPGYTVSLDKPGATVDYLSANRTQIVIGGTTSSGIFLSQDAPFGTLFSIQGGPGQAVSAVGGLVDGKVTIVILQLPPAVSN